MRSKKDRRAGTNSIEPTVAILWAVIVIVVAITVVVAVRLGRGANSNGSPPDCNRSPVRRPDRVLNHGALVPTFSVGMIWDMCCMHTWATLRCTFAPRLADSIASVARIRKVQRHSWASSFPTLPFLRHLRPDSRAGARWRRWRSLNVLRVRQSLGMQHEEKCVTRRNSADRRSINYRATSVEHRHR